MGWMEWLRGKPSERTVCEHCLACRERLYRLAFSWTGDAQLADDLVQATCEKVMAQWQAVDDTDKLEQWACRIMRNLLNDHFRRQRPSEPIEPLADSLPSEEDLEARILRDEQHLRVHHALMRLSLPLKEVLTLVDLEGYSYQEVSEILDVPLGTVMSRLHRARTQLRKELMQDGSSHLKVVNDAR